MSDMGIFDTTKTKTETMNKNTSVPKFGDWFITDAPRSLDEIKGQDVTVRTLKNWQKTGTFSKNIFFQGGFGSGKTALAKIVAKSIACKNKNDDGSPCCECPACKAVENETFDRDVVYMNAEDMAAQEVRDTLETVMKFPATRDAAKVVICDEAQALSKEAVEAFLNATQSPKQGYFFIFTAMDKLKGSKSGALQSRCKVFKMKIPTFQDIYMYLAEISKKKGLISEVPEDVRKTFFGEGLQFIAENSDYSFRKALQLLEQCFTGQVFTKDEMKEIFSIVSQDDALAALQDIADGNLSQRAWDAINGLDYQDKFPLLLAIIGDAAAVKAFGMQYVNEEERWRWQDKLKLANSPNFDALKAGFMELSSKAYISRGEWKIVCSSILSKAMVSGTTLREGAPATGGRRRPAAQ